MTKLFKKVFTAKGILLAGGVGLTAKIVDEITRYVQTNTGCFRSVHGKLDCKVHTLSCCLPGENAELPKCLENYQDPCHGYDEKKEKTCCRLCDCKYQNCLAGETLECRNPTVAEAISFFAGIVAKPVFHMVMWITIIMFGLLAFVWIGWVLWRKTAARMWRNN